MKKQTHNTATSQAQGTDADIINLVKLAALVGETDLAYLVSEGGAVIAHYSALTSGPDPSELEKIVSSLARPEGPIEAVDAARDAAFKPHGKLLAKNKIVFMAVLPVISQLGKFRGLLCLGHAKKDALNQRQKEALGLVTNQIDTWFSERLKTSRSGIKRLLEKKFAGLSYYYNAFLNGTDYGVILMDGNGTVKVFNAGAEKMLGYKASEITDQKAIFHFHDIPELAVRFSLPAGVVAPAFETYVEKPKNGTTGVDNWTFIRKNGERIIVQLSVSAIRNEQKDIIGYLAVADDITEKRKTQEELTLSEERHRFFFENSQGLMCSHDLGGRILAINTAGASLLGYEPNELTGVLLSDLVPEVLLPRLYDYLSNIASNNFATGLIKLYHKDRSVKVLYYKNVRIGSGAKSYVISNAIDVSSRIEMENDLKRAKLFAERTSQAKDQFLANMSHEIRTPMNAIIGFTDILAESPLDQEQEECVEAIRSAGENLLGIINDILDFSKIQSGKLAFEKMPFDLAETVSTTCNLLKIKAGEKGIGLNVQVNSHALTYVIGDRLRMNQILLNLIGNAIKFTEKGEVTVKLDVTETGAGKCRVHFSVKDTGIGIPHDRVDSIFDRFTQASNETTRKYGGTGLGLAISRNLVEMLGGVLKVSSREGQGSEFTFSLDFEMANQIADKSDITQAGKKKLKQNTKVLLIEDNELNRKLAKKVLTGFGFSIDTAENGLLGVEKLNNGHYDVVLMDLQMPVMDGYQATAEIRNHLRSGIPIIAMTAHSLVGEKEKCLKVGMNDYIAKPFRAADLYHKIHRLTTRTGDNPPSEAPIQPDVTAMRKVSLDRLNEISGGDKEFEKEMIGLFLKGVPEDMKNIRKNIEANNNEPVKKLCHKLRTSVMVFNLQHLESLLSEIEYSTTDGKGLSSLWLEASALIEQAMLELRKILVEKYS